VTEKAGQQLGAGTKIKPEVGNVGDCLGDCMFPTCRKLCVHRVSSAVLYCLPMHAKELVQPAPVLSL
jgi:hypothetical protein